MPTNSNEPVEQLDQVVELLHRINRSLSETVLDHEELLALGGLLTQVSGALVTLTDLLVAPVHHHDRTREPHEAIDTFTQQRHPTATASLLDCRNSYLAASTSARAFHADLKH